MEHAMKKLFSALFACLVLLFAAHEALAAQAEILLKDGGRLVGDAVLSDGGLYTITTKTVGTVTVRPESIKSIRFRAAAAKSGAALPDAQAFSRKVESVKERLVSDKELAGMIESLASDPDFRAAAADPEVTRAINAGDIAGLLSNPNIVKLLGKPEIAELGSKVSE
jgi:hypothetical protein